jgi:NAD(P)-dependent dehydrogenase (short-subunit alcohol dehydrogenase family)
MSYFQDKVVWITGATSGIGRATAQMFAHGGACIVLIARNAEQLEGTYEEICHMGGHGCMASVDVADRAAVQAMADKALGDYGRVDVLVNNAGTNVRERDIEHLTPEGWDNVVQVNLTGAFNMIHAALPAMRKQQDGLIVNVSSIAGQAVHTFTGAAYTASKFGMTGMSLELAEELWPQGIRMTALHPGEVNTPIMDRRPIPLSAEDRERMLQPQDVAETIRFLAQLDRRASVPQMTLTPTHRRI